MERQFSILLHLFVLLAWQQLHKGICFVIMPFGGWNDEYYEHIFRPAILEAGMEPHRADVLYRPGAVVQDIQPYTNAATIVLADLSHKNPNVLYELGLAHTIGKPVIMVSESLQDIPFDLRALRVIDYDKNAPDWGEAFKAKIVQAITEVLAAPTESILSVFLETDEVESGSEVSPLERDVLWPCDRRWSPSSEVLHLVVPGHGYSSPTAKY